MSHNYLKVLKDTIGVDGVNDNLYRLDYFNPRHVTVLKQRSYLELNNGSYKYLNRVDHEGYDSAQEVKGLTIVPDFVVIADYCKGRVTPETASSLVSLCDTVYVDTKAKDPRAYAGCTVKLNDEEFKRTKDFHHLFKRIVHTKGAKGCELIYPDKPHKNIYLAGSKVEPVNVSGAGDVFFATFIGCEQYLGLSPLNSLLTATAAASVSIQHINTYIPTFKEVIDARKKYCTGT